MKALFYDCETTGLPLFDQPSEDPRQPHIVQLAAMLVDLANDGEIVSSFDVICRPTDWEIPDDVAAIHGITTTRALDVGISESLAVEMLIDLWGKASVRIGHNETFDARMVRIALMRHSASIGFNPDEWKGGRAECTQRLSTPILRLPPTDKMRAAGRFHHKSANLKEAYQHFVGAELVNAHSAMADCRACLAVYQAIKGAKVAA